MLARQFSYTLPAAIEGESADVIAKAKQQITELAAVIAELTAATFIQLRSAQMDPDAEDSVNEWLASEEGVHAEELVWAAQVYGQAAQQL